MDGLKCLLPFPKLVNFTQFNKAIEGRSTGPLEGGAPGEGGGERIRAATDPLMAEHQRAIK